MSVRATNDATKSMLNEKVARWNDTFRDYPRDACLHHLLQAQAATTPDAIAVVYDAFKLTYGDLESRTNRLAHFLRNHGVTADAMIGVCMERSLELPVALQGILKSGAAYVPLDPDYPQARLAQMVEDAQLKLILTQRKLLEQYPTFFDNPNKRESPVDVICLDSDWDGMISKYRDVPLEDVATSDSLAYVIYTSGTTGKPKGVMNTHRGICNRLLWMQDEYRLGSHDTVMQKTPASFDVSVWEFFWPLIAGARLVFARPGGHLDSAYLAELIERERVTVMHFVPSMLRVFLEEPDLHRCSSLRDVICSGEALAIDLQNRFFERLDARLHNLYGPTEAAIEVTYWQCRRAGMESTVPIGSPVANTQIHLLDETLQPVPIGEAGELHIGGVQVARGYLNQPELTRERFIPDPFSDDPHARLYKTGDLARYLPDGNIDFLGRIDHQVKIRGFRIELTEIEAVLIQHPSVHLAAVAAKDYGPGDRRLVAYLVPRGAMPTQEKERSELIGAARDWIQGKLPDYMTPSMFVLLTELPMTVSGKLDRKSLPEPPRSRPELDQPLVSPRSELERRLTAKWQEVLQLEEIGVHDRFFELGGDSLRAAAFVNWLQETLNEFIYVVTIFQAPTVAEFAEMLQCDYAEAVARWLGVDDVSPVNQAARPAEPAPRRVDQALLRQLSEAIPKMRTVSETVATKNPRAVFILAPPRSGTTLLRVMLAGHPNLFAAAELQLLCFQTLTERKKAFAGKYSPWLEGAIRAIMELRHCGADEAKAIMQEHEDRQCTTKAFYRQLQQWTDGRLLVDKSPHYALDPGALRKAERDFEQPFYIHLVRHPYAMVRSFEHQHMDQILFLKEHDFTRRELGEMVWTLSHRNIRGFLARIPPARQQRIEFEQLTRNPEVVMRGLCAALGVEFHANLLNPYQDQHKKMVDGIYAASTPMGDVNFLRHQRIDPHVADRWKAVEQDDFLGDVTWELAEQFGYQRAPSGEPGGTDWSQQKAAARGRRQQQRDRRARRTSFRENDHKG